MTGLHAFLDFRANRPFFHPFDEVFHDRQGDIRFEQRHSHLAHGGINVFFRQFTDTPQLVERVLQALTQIFKHAIRSLVFEYSKL
jgi:hypothetical protein